MNAESVLLKILDEIKPEKDKKEYRIFTARFGFVFNDLFRNFQRIYGARDDFYDSLLKLSKVLWENYKKRDKELKKVDIEREKNPEWFMSEKIIAYMLYVDRFCGNLKNFISKIGYLKELGVNLIHFMPLLKSPEGNSDGGYAVSNYREIDKKFGTMEDFKEVVNVMKKENMLIMLDLVLNHSSNEHEWAMKAKAGDKKYQNYYYMYDTREIPDEFEKTMPEIFPETAPGNFTFVKEINKWVMTVFNTFQWDLNYTNPEVFIEMVDILLFLSNLGVDILRLDALAFLWKKIGTVSQNEPEAHKIIQMLKSCVKIVAPGTIFLAEAIVQPIEIIKYFGEGEMRGKECELAYNASFMVYLWDAIATKNTNLLMRGLTNMPEMPSTASWINYIRCHDDIGLGFSDRDALDVGYDPKLHRKFLIDYYTGRFYGSPAKGKPFMENPKTGDARISGTLASLCGLELALEENNPQKIERSLKKIYLLFSVILSFKGIPLIYYGDEFGSLNDYSYLQNNDTKDDNRWMHRPIFDWNKIDSILKDKDAIGYKIFNNLKKLINLRKNYQALSGYANLEYILNGNYKVFTYLRSYEDERIIVMANFDDNNQFVSLDVLKRAGIEIPIKDIISDKKIEITNNNIEIPALTCYWLIEI